MDINSLQKYIDFYHQVMPQLGNAGTGFESAMNNANYNGAALRFAMGQGENGGNGGAPSRMPDYFNFSGNGQPAPEPTNPFTARAQATQGTPYAQRPVYGAVNNYVARLLK